MKVKELIRILGQFDPEKRVVIETGTYLFKPNNIHPFTISEYPFNTTDADFGDIIIEAVSEYKI